VSLPRAAAFHIAEAAHQAALAMTTSVERATFLQDLEAPPASSRRVGMIVAPIGGMSRPSGTTGVVPPRAKGEPAGDVDVPSNRHVVEVLDPVDDGMPHNAGLSGGRTQGRPAALPERARRLHELRLTRAAMDCTSAPPDTITATHTRRDVTDVQHIGASRGEPH
jgi:hypothetical protein